MDGNKKKAEFTGSLRSECGPALPFRTLGSPGPRRNLYMHTPFPQTFSVLRTKMGAGQEPRGPHL